VRGNPDPAATGSAFSDVGVEVLLCLGVDVYAPLTNLRSVFERLLPEASSCGYFEALRLAFCRGEATPGDDDDQLRWLVDHLNLEKPNGDDAYGSWAIAWDVAAESVGRPVPTELDPRARRVLIDELRARPSYRLRLADALTEALRTQLKS
jgi:hypothetical protein